MKILIAEDEPVFRKLLEETLVRWGYEVVATNDGNEAWQALQAEDAPRLAILDWLMPGMDGPELCRAVRKQEKPYIYIILLTSQQKDEDLVIGMEAGADDYLTKPFKTNELKVRLNAGRRIIKLQNELAAHAAELEVVNSDLESFSYTVSNDLLKSLITIGDYARTIQDFSCKDDDEQCKSNAKRIYDKTRHLALLIGIMHDYFRPMRTDLHRETLDLSDIARKTAEKFRLTNPDRRVTFLIADGIRVNADRDLLQRALNNLIGNAWKHTGKREDAVIEFGLTDVEGMSACFVRDNGAGFDMAHADRLFKPFRPLPGTEEYAADGIGLATVERIIRRHGGKVWAEGGPDKGACFYFTLPELAHAAPEPPLG
ncbi:sensor histidine kinase [Geobacter argillaceus]|uniref:histidine kinase n=1 Tax=Geobacter argillaceus TaxID=345631 RepID=A0A562VMQ8_9BACT|nr:response regulator [Geobacter argillaceus]TWJ19189.1 histidine kinase/DNA gyrase B/HSP90-like ATPase [Geobacter argillaceus]